METQLTTGRKIVVGVIIATIALSLISIITSVLVDGQPLPAHLVRFLLTILLCLFLYRGANWARWIVVILLLLAGPSAVLAGLTLLPHPGSAALLIIIGLVYTTSAILLMFVPAVRAHFRPRKHLAS